MADMKYNFLDDNFTVFESVKTPKVQLDMPLFDNPLDISDWSSGITGNGVPIVKDNVPQTKFIVNNTEEFRPTTKEKSPVKEESIKEENNIKYNENNTLYIMNSLIDKGFEPHQAAGIVGNLMSESGLNPGAYNPNDVGLPGGGLAGWRGENFAKLKNFANDKGKSWKDLDSQIEFLLSSISSDVGERLSRAKNPHEASEAWAYYERYAGYDGTIKTARKAGWSQERVNKEHKKRSENANKAYNLWKSQYA